MVDWLVEGSARNSPTLLCVSTMGESGNTWTSDPTARVLIEGV